MNPSHRFARALVALGLAALAIRLVHLWEQSVSLPFLGRPILDAALYHEWASSLAAGDGAYGPPFYHAPGYAFFLSTVYTIFGPSPMAGILVQTILGIGTVLLTALLGRRLFGPLEGVIAGGILLFVGPLYFFEVKLLATTLAIFLSVLTVLLAVMAEGKTPGTGGRVWIVGVLAGLSGAMLAVVRANLLLFPILLIGLLLYRGIRGKDGSRRRASRRLAASMGAGLVLGLLPLFTLNLRAGVAAPVATNGGFNFYAGNRRGATGVYTDFAGVSGMIRNQEAEADSLVRVDLGRTLRPGEESRYWLERGLREVRADPAAWLRLEARKAQLLVNRQEETVNGSLAVERREVLVLRFAAFPFNLLAGLGLIGLVFAGGRFRPPRGLRMSRASPVAFLLAVAFTGLGFFVMTRLRLPAAPFLAVLAAYAVVRAGESWREGGRIPVIAGTAGLLVWTALTWVSPLGAARNVDWEARLFLEAGRLLELEGEQERAAEAYGKARKIQPASLDALRREAEMAVQAGDVARAIEVMEEAVLLAPRSYVVVNNLGILYYVAGRPDDCLRTMELASGLDPSAGSPYLYRGRILAERGDPAARAVLEEALERDPSLLGAYVGLIDLDLAAGDTASAARRAALADSAGVTLPPEVLARLR